MTSYDKELLFKILRDNSAKLIGEYSKLNSVTKITFECNCGKETVRQFLWLNHGKGALCKKCSFNDRSENTKKITQQKRLDYLHKTSKENNVFILDIYEEINNDTLIKFLCKCGTGSEKIFNSICANNIILCKVCTEEHRAE